MIQAISPANIQTNKASTPLKQQSFKGKQDGYQRPSVASRMATQFATGAVVSVIWDGVGNLFNKMAKKPPSTTGFGQFAHRAAFLGVVFVAADLVFQGIHKLFDKK